MQILETARGLIGMRDARGDYDKEPGIKIDRIRPDAQRSLSAGIINQFVGLMNMFAHTEYICEQAADILNVIQVLSPRLILSQDMGNIYLFMAFLYVMGNYPAYNEHQFPFTPQKRGKTMTQADFGAG